MTDLIATIRAEHQRQEVGTPDDFVDVSCSRCYLFDEGWPCSTIQLADALDVARASQPSSDLATLRNHEGCRLTVGDFEDYGWALVCESHDSGPLIALATPAASSEAAAEAKGPVVGWRWAAVLSALHRHGIAYKTLPEGVRAALAAGAAFADAPVEGDADFDATATDYRRGSPQYDPAAVAAASQGDECRTEDHVGQITQLGEMVDAARKETVCPRHPDHSLSMCVVCVTEAAPRGDEGLEEAWHEAEAALPDGWSNGPSLFGYDVMGGGRSYVATVYPPKPYPRARRPAIVADGSTPAAALRALAAKLAALAAEEERT